MMIMMLNADSTTTLGTKKRQYVTFNSMMSPMTVGQMADMGYAFEGVIGPNDYRGLAIGISFPVQASEFPKRSDVQDFLGLIHR